MIVWERGYLTERKKQFTLLIKQLYVFNVQSVSTHTVQFLIWTAFEADSAFKGSA